MSSGSEAEEAGDYGRARGGLGRYARAWARSASFSEDVVVEAAHRPAQRPAPRQNQGAAPRGRAQEQSPAQGPAPAMMRDNPGVLEVDQAERGLVIGICPTMVARLTTLQTPADQVALRTRQDRAHNALWNAEPQARDRSRSRSRSRERAEHIQILQMPTGACAICLRDDENVDGMNERIMTDCASLRYNMASVSHRAYIQLCKDDEGTRARSDKARRAITLGEVQAHVRSCMFAKPVVDLRLLEGNLNLLDQTLATGTIATTNAHGCRSSILAPGVEQRVKIFSDLVMKISATTGADRSSKFGKKASGAQLIKQTSGVTVIPRMRKGHRIGLTNATVTQTTTTTTRAVLGGTFV